MAFGNATKGYVKKHSGGGGGGGTTNYSELSNKPSINGVTLDGNKTSEDLNIGGGGFSFTEVTVTNKVATINNYDSINGIYLEFRLYNHSDNIVEPKIIFKPTINNVESGGYLNMKYGSDSLNCGVAKNDNTLTLTYGGSNDYTMHCYTF